MSIFLIVIFSVFVGLKLPFWLTNLVSRYEKRKIMKLLTPTSVHENKLCNSPHAWVDATSVDDNNSYTFVKVCETCGFIPSKNLMATKAAIERIKENNRIRKINEDLEKSFIDMENEDLKKEFEQDIAKGLDYSKLLQVYLRGQTSAKRYVIFKISKFEELGK